MRRKEREKDREFAESIIDKCTYMTLSMVGADGEPYCVPLSPVRWNGCVYFHCALAGRKLEALRAHPGVCMTFVGDTRVPRGEFTTYYESAVAFGAAEEVRDVDEKSEALRRLCLKYCAADMDLFEGELARSLPHTGVWKVSLDEVTGKGKIPPDSV